MAERRTVAVIGAGALGLVTIKNLLEEGFDVTGFERNAYVGGLWQYTEDDKTSVLQSTIVNVSKERGCFTDLPFQEGVRTHPTAAEVQQYLLQYVKHFNLASRIQLNTSIKNVTYSDEHQKWAVHIEGSDPIFFDKVVMATGINTVASIPNVKNIDLFEGRCIHSRFFKRPEEFEGRKVLVVGFGNTAADTATQLVGNASKIYLSHRHGGVILPRKQNNQSIDHGLNYRKQTISDTLWYYAPGVAEYIFNTFLAKMQNKSFTIRPEWGLSPAPSMKQSIPIISDVLVDGFEKGDIESVAGLEKVTGPNQVELSDGTKLDVDTIIYCTGYKIDYSLLEPKYDPTTRTTQKWSEAHGSNGKPLPRLYRNVFSLEKPESLAFMGTVAFPSPAFQTYDIASMALAQIWKGNSNLPGRHEMIDDVDAHHEWVCGMAKDGSVYPGIVKGGEWMRWANDAAGTGINENLGYRWKGWVFWLRNRSLCQMIMGGIYSPHVFRLFEGKRKRWEGARKAIEKVNRDNGLYGLVKDKNN
ncbi:FAD/NAD(P)-binding domain-containing protein [Aaosphaeria arxii CBS 175.79]|uniref:FAD/NAD(P)-binding domain-containing protein n=1 Tax=Aaosphaeria arxii CBS 175.79 TaxID=1450172 RepID=A0A6A5XZW1_9PLEO|nr:FAD/NAD(P)-binding domain-containing protein [Aaosphaeria arxii CBS 175.79]KAF2018251.1 FAD/NAD(P)-binding domain-containing protein [Aaosphaeria arxii CBS 175.79]